MKNVTSMMVALLGLAALAPAQTQREGSFARHFRSAPREVVTAHRVGSPVVQHPTLVSHRTANRVQRGSRAHGGNRFVRHGQRHGYRHANRHGHGHRHGYYQTIRERVWVPGYYRTEHVPAVYGWVYDSCGRRYWGIVEPACSRQVHVPGCYEWRTRRVWVGC